MPKSRDNVTVEAVGGAYVNIAATIPARRVVISEDPNNGAAQGITYQLGSEAFAVTHKLGATEQLVLGDSVTAGNNAGPILGFPAQNAPATAWLIGDAHVKNDLVTDDGFAYVAQKATIGEKPVLFPASWAVIRNYIPATIYAKIRSGANATKARVYEEE